jgi:tRNA (cmo5U34)-methyltransferase
MENQTKDKLFERDFAAVKSFAFDEQVTEVFADMIKRSVPGYDSILKSIAMFCMKYAQENSNIYDLGCSLGAVSITAAKATKDKSNCNIKAIDTSQPMLDKCQDIINENKLSTSIDVINQDITALKIENASVVVSNFTIQFVPKDQRLQIIDSVYKGLNKGGIFILSEKFKSHASADEFLIDHYHAYKKINGYSNNEIQAKRQALKDVLVPDSIVDMQNRL